MPSAELYLPEYTQLTQDCRTFIAEHHVDSAAAQVLLSRVRNLRTNLNALDAGEPQVATWIKALENNILELFPIVYQAVDRNNGRRDVVAAQHLGFLKDANDKFALYKPKANNPNLTKAEKEDYLKFWEELKNIIAQMQDFVEISQRLKGDNVIIQNDSLEKAQQMLREVEQWPVIADRINQPQIKANPSPLMNDLQNVFAARVHDAAEIGNSGAALVSEPWNLPPQPLTPLESAMVILDKSPNKKEQTYSWEISKDQHTIAKISNPTVYDTKKSPAENAAHIRDLDRMLLAYAVGRDPSLWGTPIEIDGTDAMSRAILMQLCEYHDLPYKNMVKTNPITNKIFLAEIDKQAKIECKNQPQLPRTKFTPPPIFGDTARDNLKPPPSIAVDDQWRARAVGNLQYTHIDLPGSLDAVEIAPISLPAPNLEYQGLPASSPHYQAISHPDNQNNQANAVLNPISSEPGSANAAEHYKQMPRRETTLARENNAGWANLAADEQPYDKIGLASQSQSNANSFASNLPTLVLNQEQWDRILPNADYQPVQLAQVALPISQQYQARPEPVHGQYVRVNREAGDGNVQMQIQNRSRSALQAPARTWPAAEGNKENVAVENTGNVKMDSGNSIGALVEKKIAETPVVSAPTSNVSGKPRKITPEVIDTEDSASPDSKNSPNM